MNIFWNIQTIYETVELIIVLGGDGTIMDAACKATARATPVLGINLGRVGYLEDEMSLDEFAKFVKDKLSSPFVLYNGSKTVKKVYVVGGDGKDLIDNAIFAGADTILTGRGSYNTTIDATDMGINIVEAGHFYTENPVCERLCEIIKKADKSLLVEIYNSNEIKAI